VSPALVHDLDGDALEGSGVLRDLGGGPLSVVLWQAGREVMLWTRANGPRAGLFVAGAHRERLAVLRSLKVPEEVAPLLRALSEAVLKEPELTDANDVALLCRHASEWALDAGAHESAVWFAQAAAFALPTSGRLALRTGIAARRAGKLLRAESWLLRAVGLARKRDWSVYAESYVELARVSEQRGDRALARRRFHSARRAARRNGIRDLRGKALHGLLRLAMDEGDLAEASRVAHFARRCVSLSDPGRPRLDADLAALFIRSGETGRALHLLGNLLSVATEPRERMLLLALQAHAYGLEGQSVPLADAWTAAWDLASEGGGGDGEPRTRALLALAAAALAAGNVRHARLAEDAARDLACDPLERWLVGAHLARVGGNHGC